MSKIVVRRGCMVTSGVALDEFTKKAIEKSGNTSMTDTQKLALDGLFRSLGALSNSTLWQKVDMMLLPIIGANGVNHLIVDYTERHTLTAGQYLADKNGAMESSVTGSLIIVATIDTPTSPYILKGTNMLVSSSIGSTIDPTAGVDFKLSYKSGGIEAIKKISVYNSTTLVSGLDRGGSHPSVRYYSEVILVSDLMQTDSAGVYSYGVDTSDARVDARNTIRIGDITNIPDNYVNSSVGYIYLSNLSVGIVIDFNDALSSDERETVLSAVTLFRNAFKS